MENILASLKLAHKQKKQKIYISKHKKNKHILIFLIRQGIISTFKEIPLYLIVYLKIPFFSIFEYKILNLSRKGTSLKYLGLCKLLHKDPFFLYIIKTIDGLQTL